MNSKVTGVGEEEVKKCLNVRQKLGTWKFFYVFLRFSMFSNVFQCYLLSFSLSLTLTLSHYLTLSLSVTLSHSFSLSLTLTLSHAQTFSQLSPDDIWNNFHFDT